MGRVSSRRSVRGASSTLALLLVVCVCLQEPVTVSACTFCSAITHTLTDNIRDGQVAVLATCVAVRPAAKKGDLPAYRFQIQDVLKGAEVKAGLVEAFSRDPIVPGARCLLVGFGEAPYEWTTPVPLSETAGKYLQGLPALPEKGAERLAYFLPYLPSPDPVVADDAYNEFARATFAEVAEIRDRLDRRQVRALIGDSATPVNRRRLYWLFLGLCGRPEDAVLFDEVLDRQRRDPMFNPGLDAALASYLTLLGEPGLVQMEQRYLRNPNCAYADSYAAVAAIRFQGEERTQFTKARLAKALRAALERPQLADLVIADLARWEDWSAVPRLVELYKQAKDQESVLRPPVVNYLKVCPLPAATAALDELRRFDPEGVRRAEALSLFPSAPR